MPLPVVPGPWPAVLLLYAAGLMAAAQLGKMSALVPVISPALNLSLMGAAWTVSLLEIGGATLGAVASGLALRLGLWRSLQWGLVALAAAGLGSASAAGGPSLMLWRLLEAAGYLGVTVSAPVLMAQLTARLTAVRGTEARDGLGGRQPHAQMLTMTLWSTFVSVGVALGASGAAAAALPWGWRGTLLAGGLLAAALALATRALAPAITPAITPCHCAGRPCWLWHCRPARSGACSQPSRMPTGPWDWPSPSTCSAVCMPVGLAGDARAVRPRYTGARPGGEQPLEKSAANLQHPGRADCVEPHNAAGKSNQAGLVIGPFSRSPVHASFAPR